MIINLLNALIPVMPGNWDSSWVIPPPRRKPLFLCTILPLSRGFHLTLVTTSIRRKGANPDELPPLSSSGGLKIANRRIILEVIPFVVYHPVHVGAIINIYQGPKLLRTRFTPLGACPKTWSRIKSVFARKLCNTHYPGFNHPTPPVRNYVREF